jgi:sarcosine oxidase
MTVYDVAVIGLGAMGSAAIHALARRGVRAVGLDRYEPAHHRSSSFGESRVIRLAYFEHPDYVPLLRSAYAAWRALEDLTGERVLTVTGIVEAGCPGADLVENSLRSAELHGLDHQLLTPGQVNARFPAFDIPADWTCLFQPDAGALFPEKAIGLFVTAAQTAGAVIRPHTAVREVRPKGGRVEIRLEDGGLIDAGAAIVSAGAWVGDLIPELAHATTLTRQPLLWFDSPDRTLVGPDRLPVFFLQPPDALVYGLPDLCGSGVKAASHLSGGELASAEAPRADVSAAEATLVRDTLSRYLPGAAGPVRQTSLCVYTRTADEHFVIGPHPAAPQIILASPCSGHGFKFASIIGEILADLAVDGATDHPIGLFDPRRLPA